jgi:hypothetical protein
MNATIIVGGAVLVAGAGLVLVWRREQESAASASAQAAQQMPGAGAAQPGQPAQGSLFADGGPLSPEGLGAIASTAAGALGMPQPLAAAGGALVSSTGNLGQVIAGREEGSLAGVTQSGLGGTVGYRIASEVADALELSGTGTTAAEVGGTVAGVAAGVVGAAAAVSAVYTTAVVVGVTELASFLGGGGISEYEKKRADAIVAYLSQLPPEQVAGKSATELLRMGEANLTGAFEQVKQLAPEQVAGKSATELLRLGEANMDALRNEEFLRITGVRREDVNKKPPLEIARLMQLYQKKRTIP